MKEPDPTIAFADFVKQLKAKAMNESKSLRYYAGRTIDNALPEVGATFAGFIFYPKSPRYVLRHMTTSQIKKENNINKVGVFVNASVEEVLQMVDECRLHMVQLHGDETPEYCEKIADYISVVKAFRVSETIILNGVIQEYMDVCDMFMFDTEGAGYGGTGKKFNLEKIERCNGRQTLFLKWRHRSGEM